MRYLGGKARQSRSILETILTERGECSRYIEPFVGGGSVFSVVAPHFDEAVAGDAVPELVSFWNAISKGWEPPATMTHEEWITLRNDPCPSPLKGWAAYAASYNGKYFAGYGPTAVGRDYLDESRRSTIRKAAGFFGRRVVCCDYSEHKVDSNTVVYCDPPYDGTEQYGAVAGFDHVRFWNIAEWWSYLGATVLVHEYKAPKNWVIAHEKNRVETMHHGGPSSGVRTERLFILPKS